jgi:hypothetical protein
LIGTARRARRGIALFATSRSSRVRFPPTAAPTMIIDGATSGAQRTVADRTTSLRRLDAVREILRALETATTGGQQHLMLKVLGLLRREAPARDRWVGEQQWQTIANTLDALAREASRMAPDAAEFRRQATLVADSLGPR